MILIDLTGSESHPLYQELEIANGNRHYDFLKSIVEIAVKAGTPYLSHQILKALNFHAIACLHTNAGEYRPCAVGVWSKDGDGNYIKTYEPPEPFQVEALMDDFINNVNRYWSSTSPIALCAYVLWRLNYIHPFINGNGRTARAACYFVLCVSFEGWLPGKMILPELISRDRPEYVQALQLVDASAAAGALELAPLIALLERLVNEQVKSATAPEPVEPVPA